MNFAGTPERDDEFRQVGGLEHHCQQPVLRLHTRIFGRLNEITLAH